MSDRWDLPQLAQLSTEARNPRTESMDTLSPTDLVRTLHRENHDVADAVNAALPEIARAVELIACRLACGGHLIYVGAGTSGRLGVLDASECPPTFGVAADLVQGIIAGGDIALRTSVEGAEDDPRGGAESLRGISLTERDVVVGIAASGRTPYVLGALAYARERGAATVAVVNVSPSAMDANADIVIAAITGAEPLTGSTRLKAGSAQKMVLNLLSTGAMVLLGKTYGNLMVDVRATNAKLRDRAIRIVQAATGCDSLAAGNALEQTDWSAKPAIVMIRLGIEAEEARSRLDSANGFVRKALEAKPIT